MARKGQAIQLQIEVENDEEWEKLLQRQGLILIDVFSGWAGPCAGMIATLKKIKMESGGDNFHLAIAKSDEITVLERFRNKSEPTWMFVSGGKMVNIIFGCNAPHLTRTILDEIKMENLVRSGEKIRDKVMEVTDLTPDEEEREKAEQDALLAAQVKADAKKAKELDDRLVAEAKAILENVMFGTVLIFPNAKEAYQQSLKSFIDAAGLMLHSTEKIQMNEEMLESLLYFCEDKEDQFNEDSVEDLLNDTCVWLLIKLHAGSDAPDMDNEILTLVYGETKKPPGDPEYPYTILYHTVEVEEIKDGITTLTTKDLMGIWVPPNANVRATALKLFFSKYTKAFEIPEPEPTPPYLAVVFDNYQIPEVKQLMSQYPNEILNYGFFTSDNLENTQLVAKSFKRLENPETTPRRTYQEKLIIQLARRKSECVLAFAQLNPVHMSPNSDQGAQECPLVFPDEYEESLDEEDFNFSEIEDDPAEKIGEEEEGGESMEEELLEEEEIEEEEDEEEGDEDERNSAFQDMFEFEPDVVTKQPETPDVPVEEG